ncbi:unnamed protein product [Laminaria digitata]
MGARVILVAAMLPYEKPASFSLPSPVLETRFSFLVSPSLHIFFSVFCLVFFSSLLFLDLYLVRFWYVLFCNSRTECVPFFFVCVCVCRRLLASGAVHMHA